MNSWEKVLIGELELGSKFRVSMNDKELLTISDIDNEMAYCNHFIGLNVLPLERFVYAVHNKEALSNTTS
ncbi:MAG: hypothetical protein RLO12_02365 [Fulvivirga sp.]